MYYRKYQLCPAKLEGYKWQASVRSRYFSGSWGFDSFREALKYLRDQYAHAVERTKAFNNPGDQWCEKEYWGFIEGPGGTMEWDTIEQLVKS